MVVGARRVENSYGLIVNAHPRYGNYSKWGGITNIGNIEARIKSFCGRRNSSLDNDWSLWDYNTLASFTNY